MKKSRRQFMEDSLFASAAAIAAGPLSRTYAQESSSSGSPNDTLSVAVIGVRGRGGDHLNNFVRIQGTEVTHVCDADTDVGQSRVEQVGRRQGRAPKYVKDMRELFDDPSIDIVSIATPNHWHALAAIWALQAGKHVYVEKPVSHNVSEGRRIVEAARKYGKICQTGTQCRTNPGMRAAMEHVQNGGIGTVQVGRGLCYKRRTSIGPRGVYEVPPQVDYDLWSGPAELAPLTRPNFHYDWHWQWPYGNGDLGNQGIHQMDLARWGLDVHRFPDTVLSYGGRFGYEDAGDTANTQIVIHDYGDKSLVFEVRGLKTDDLRGATVGVIFEGSDGYLVMTSYDSGAAFDLDGNVVKEFSGGANHYENFLAAVRAGNPDLLNADIEQGHLSSALCHLGNISYRLGETMPQPELLERLQSLDCRDNVKATLDRTVEHLESNDVSVSEHPFRVGMRLKVDSATESFQDNEQANAMLTRPYRQPYVVPGAGQV